MHRPCGGYDSESSEGGPWVTSDLLGKLMQALVDLLGKLQLHFVGRRHQCLGGVRVYGSAESNGQNQMHRASTRDERGQGAVTRDGVGLTFLFADPLSKQLKRIFEVLVHLRHEIVERRPFFGGNRPCGGAESNCQNTDAPYEHAR